MSDVLLPTAEVCIEVASRELITKDLIIRTEYEGQRRPTVTVLEVPPQVIEEHLAIYLHQYDQILGATSDNVNGRFDIMLGCLAFVSVPNCLDFVAGPVIVAGRKPTCWKCGETDHVESS